MQRLERKKWIDLLVSKVTRFWYFFKRFILYCLKFLLIAFTRLIILIIYGFWIGVIMALGFFFVIAVVWLLQQFCLFLYTSVRASIIVFVVGPFLICWYLLDDILLPFIWKPIREEFENAADYRTFSLFCLKYMVLTLLHGLFIYASGVFIGFVIRSNFVFGSTKGSKPAAQRIETNQISMLENNDRCEWNQAVRGGGTEGIPLLRVSRRRGRILHNPLLQEQDHEHVPPVLVNESYLKDPILEEMISADIQKQMNFEHAIARYENIELNGHDGFFGPDLKTKQFLASHFYMVKPSIGNLIEIAAKVEIPKSSSQLEKSSNSFLDEEMIQKKQASDVVSRKKKRHRKHKVRNSESKLRIKKDKRLLKAVKSQSKAVGAFEKMRKFFFPAPIPASFRYYTW